MIKKTLFLAIFTFVFVGAPLSAGAEEYESLTGGYAYPEIDEYNVDIEVMEDGSIQVVEKILYDFNNELRHGILRNIPILYGDYGEEVEIPITLNGVTNEKGEPYIYEDYDYYYDKEIKIGDPSAYVTGENWYYIHYTAGAVINGFDSYDELYWNAIPTEWDVPINAGVVTVKIPEGGDINMNSAVCYTGVFGASEELCKVRVISPTEFRYELTQGLGTYEGMTIVANFSKGLSSASSFIEVNSFPSGASIYIDGEDIYRTTPTVLRRIAGNYLVELDLWKYKLYSENVSFETGTRKFVFAELEKKLLYVILDFYLPVAIFIFGIMFVFYLWWTRGRDPEGKGTIMPFYKAPKVYGKGGVQVEGRSISPGEMGVLIDETAHLHDITATIVQLAVKGYLKIRKEEEKARYDWGNDPAFTFIKLKDLKGNDLELFEQKIFNAIFEGGKNAKKEVRLSSLQRKFYKDLPAIKKELYKKTVDEGFFVKDPDKVRGDYLVAGIVFIVLFFIGGGMMMAILGTGMYLLLLPWIGVFLFLISFVMPKKTAYGREVYENLLGYKMFLAAAEEDRLKVLFDPKDYKEVFAENLPYAMVLEVEKKWAKQFKGLYDELPDWYEGGKGLDDFAKGMRSFSNIAAKTYVSAPKPVSTGGSYKSGGGSGWGSGWSGGGSSSWSGSSGSSGGFSGGGFGGGGGSSW